MVLFFIQTLRRYLILFYKTLNGSHYSFPMFLGYKDTDVLENVKIISKNKESRNTRDGTVQKPTPQLFVC